MKTIFGITLFIFVIVNVSFADTLKSIDDTKNLSDKMMNHFIKKEFKEGIDLAKLYWPIAEVELDGLLNQILNQWPIVDKRFGNPIGIDFVSKEMIGSSFVRYTYLHKFENHAIYWLFTFYKPKDEWIVNGVSFQDSLETLFENAE